MPIFDYTLSNVTDWNLDPTTANIITSRKVLKVLVKEIFKIKLKDMSIQ